MKITTNIGPHFPDTETVRGRILGALLRGDKLTQQDALHRFSNLRLAADINVLRNSGWGIETEMIEAATRDAGRRAEIARYHMPESTRLAAGEHGQQYAEQARKAEIARRAY